LRTKRKISRLVLRISFYSYFIIWSLSSFFILPDYKNSTTTNNEPYLAVAKINSSFYTLNEENKKTRYSQDNNSKLYYSTKFLVPFSFQIFKLSGSFYFIQPREVPVIINVFALIDLSRPPPFIS
jgi:hypothetical protein